jgi:tetratricopeptide (TPR) repeat protein
MSYLASAYLDNRQSEEALLLFTEIYERRNATLGPENQDTLKSMYALARSYQVVGKLQESLDLFRKMLAATEKRNPLPKGYPQVSDTRARIEEILPLLKPKQP